MKSYALEPNNGARHRTDEVSRGKDRPHLQRDCLPNRPMSWVCHLLITILSGNLKNKVVAENLTREELRWYGWVEYRGTLLVPSKAACYSCAVLLLASLNTFSSVTYSRLEVGPNTCSQRVGTQSGAQTSSTATVLPEKRKLALKGLVVRTLLAWRQCLTTCLWLPCNSEMNLPLPFKC